MATAKKNASRKTTKKKKRKSSKKKSTKSKKPAGGGFTPLEKNILAAKGVTAAQLSKMLAAGIESCADFATVGDAGTLGQLIGMPSETAAAVMAWAGVGGGTPAGGTQVGGSGGTNVVIESADIVHCTHCHTRQPKDYQAGNLCPACGKQAEPVLTCYWCGASGPGKFCRQCGARFVPAGELELALLLKREGESKEKIAAKLEALSDAEKQALWGRVRR